MEIGPDSGTTFLGSSPAARDVRSQLRCAARVDCPVLVLGDSGVGKELVAREVHGRSARARGPFVTVNCSAIPETLIENELFGHEAGAYTDARRSHRGAFEMARGGVLFLDEIGDLSPAAQPKLLRAIESGEVRRVGDERTREIDLRIVAATHQDLRRMRDDGLFREDLYYRIDILEIRVPPLRERSGDIEELAAHFARRIAAKNGQRFLEFDVGALRLLRAHDWPGNVRELRAVVERALAREPTGRLTAASLTLEPIASALSLRRLFDADWQTAHREFERAYIRDLLGRHRTLHEAARAAHLSPRGVYKILERLGIRRADAGAGRRL